MIAWVRCSMSRTPNEVSGTVSTRAHSAPGQSQAAATTKRCTITAPKTKIRRGLTAPVAENGSRASDLSGRNMMPPPATALVQRIPEITDAALQAAVFCDGRVEH